MQMKKIASSFLIISFVIIGTAGTWATVTSDAKQATTGAIRTELPTFSLTLTPQKITSLSTDEQPTFVGTLTFSPDGAETIGDAAIIKVEKNTAKSVGGLADDLILYVQKSNGMDLVYTGDNVPDTYTCNPLPDWGIGVKKDGKVTAKVYAAFINNDKDQTPDLAAGNVAVFDITGMIKTAPM